jgi:hypothetical protein
LERENNEMLSQEIGVVLERTGERRGRGRRRG